MNKNWLYQNKLIQPYFRSLQYPEQNKSDGIDCKVCKHMYKPGRINVVVSFVKIVKDTAADYESCKKKQKYSDMEHSDKHSHVVECEKGRTEDVCEFS